MLRRFLLLLSPCCLALVLFFSCTAETKSSVESNKDSREDTGTTPKFRLDLDFPPLASAKPVADVSMTFAERDYTQIATRLAGAITPGAKPGEGGYTLALPAGHTFVAAASLDVTDGDPITIDRQKLSYALPASALPASALPAQISSANALPASLLPMEAFPAGALPASYFFSAQAALPAASDSVAVALLFVHLAEDTLRIVCPITIVGAEAVISCPISATFAKPRFDILIVTVTYEQFLALTFNYKSYREPLAYFHESIDMLHKTNTRPTLAMQPHYDVVAGKETRVPLAVTDPDADLILASASGLPPFARIEHGVLIINPASEDAGKQFVVGIDLQDNGNPCLGAKQDGITFTVVDN